MTENIELTPEEKEKLRKEHNRKWYQNTYDSLIERGKTRGLNKKELKKSGDTTYYEKHHIIPKCLGGTNDISNLVLLTYKEHIIAHKLLCKLYPEEGKLFLAVNRMLSVSNSDKSNPNVRIKISLKEAIEYKREGFRKTKIDWSKVVRPIPTKEHNNSISNSKKGKLPPQNSLNNLKHGIKVIDDKGNIFNSVKDCAEFYNTSSTSIIRLCKSNKSNFNYLNNISLPSKRKVYGEGIIYNNRKEAAIKLNRTISTINNWIKNPNKDWKLLDEVSDISITNEHKTKISLGLLNGKNTGKSIQGPDGTIYKSMKEAEKASGHDRHVLRKWIKNNPEKGWKDIN